ncbi:MAG: hypothetical protein HQL09_07120 [Nitrospirae bacterium]|nr:hypothetical protein [Nitrospirota bacterium]
MGISDAINSAASALNAFGDRQAVTANNIANINTKGFLSTDANMSETVNGGVKVTLSQNPDSDGVDEAKEMVNMIINKAGVEANVKSVQTADKMLKTINKMV